jgi:Lysyl oxidase/WD40-like Beta Propeller Repeat
MGCIAFAAAVVAASVSGAQGGSAATPTVGAIAFERHGEIFVRTLATGVTRRLTRTPVRESEPAISPDGTLVAYVRRGDVFVRNVDGSGERRVLATPAEEAWPAWSPDGRLLALVQGSRLVIVALSGSVQQVIRVGGSIGRLGWAPDGSRIVLASDALGDDDVYVADVASRRLTPLTEPGFNEQDPVWTPDGTRVVFSSDRDGPARLLSVAVSGGDERDLTSGAVEGDTRPVYSPDGRDLLFARDGRLVVADSGSLAAPEPIGIEGTAPSWGRRVAHRLLLPDFDQRAPHGLAVTSSGKRVLLGFDSAVDNIGEGPIWIHASRASVREPEMQATQLVERQGGGVFRVHGVGWARYSPHPPHFHWHFGPFERFELRRPRDFKLLVRDHKIGFCLADHWGISRRRVKGFGPPRFLGKCGTGGTKLLSVEQGNSVGYTDRYPANIHGQYIDITHVPAGRYVLVHRANPENLIRERNYDNNTASVAIFLSRPPGSLPHVRVLAVCEGNDQCPVQHQ